MTTENPSNRLHPKVDEALDLMRRGKLDRRGFVRIAALLGVGATTAYAMADCRARPWPRTISPFPRSRAIRCPAARSGSP